MRAGRGGGPRADRDGRGRCAARGGQRQRRPRHAAARPLLGARRARRPWPCSLRSPQCSRAWPALQASPCRPRCMPTEVACPQCVCMLLPVSCAAPAATILGRRCSYAALQPPLGLGVAGTVPTRGAPPGRAACRSPLPGAVGGPSAAAPEEAASKAMHLTVDIGILEVLPGLAAQPGGSARVCRALTRGSARGSRDRPERTLRTRATRCRSLCRSLPSAKQCVG